MLIDLRVQTVIPMRLFLIYLITKEILISNQIFLVHTRLGILKQKVSELKFSYQNSEENFDILWVGPELINIITKMN